MSDRCVSDRETSAFQRRAGCKDGHKGTVQMRYNYMFSEVYSVRTGPWTVSRGYKKSLKDNAGLENENSLFTEVIIFVFK